jgi:hypothetical protein
MTSTIPYADNRELLDHNISVYTTAIQEWDGCSCELERMTARLAELLQAKESNNEV